MSGERFYYNDGVTYPMDEQDMSGILEVREAVGGEKTGDVIAVMSMTDHDLIAYTDFEYVYVHLTKTAAKELADYLVKIITEDK